MARFLLMEAHPRIVRWPVLLVYNKAGNDRWLWSPSFFSVGSNISHVEKQLVVVSQHEEVLCVLLTNQFCKMMI